MSSVVGISSTFSYASVSYSGSSNSDKSKSNLFISLEIPKESLIIL